MLIRKVAIQGFKTFARRTEFVFDPGVTAVVGPNGSGKSNIVDAVRWCLGEQSFSLLRSKKSSDVIFSGSDQRARLGLAQVSVTLDNSGGELPIDYAEVEITRRAYRDGDNEYLLNGRRVRLQDVTDLLAQTGLGKRTYALIGQGLIDRILSLAPDELRGLFEEAAGITGYQAKRAATMRRLEATRQNLTRVQDILAELNPRLVTLRRQAARAQEREQLAEDLRGLLLEWYGFHWHTALLETDRRRHEVAERQRLVADHKESALAAGAEVQKLQGELTQHRAQVAELHRDSSRIHRQTETTGRELAVSQERLRQMQTRLDEAARAQAALETQSASLTDRIAAAERELQAAENLTAQRKQETDAVQVALSAQQQARRAAQETLAAARKAHVDLQTAVAQQTSRRKQFEDRLSVLREERAKLTTEATSAATAEDATLREVTALRTQAAEVESELQQRRAELAEHEQRIADQRTAQNELQQQRATLQRDLDQLQTRLDLLTRLRNEGAGYASGVRSVLQAAGAPEGSKDRLAGILGTVASLLEVPAEIDKAIETALGGAFQNIVTSGWSDAEAAIKYLDRTRSGRATFLPLDRLSSLPKIAAPKLPGVLGNAVDLVEYAPAARAAVEQLLSRVWVVRDLPAARAALDSLREGPRPTVVTLTGEIVRPGGAVTGGADSSRRDESILAREREFRALPAQVSQAADQLRAMDHQLNEIAAAIGSLTSLADHTRSDLNTLVARHDALQRRAQELQSTLDRTRQAQTYVEDRASRIAAEIEQTERGIAEIDTLLIEIEAQRSQAEEAVAVAEAAADETTSEEILGRLADLRGYAAEADTQARNLRRTLDALRAELQQTDERARREQSQIERLEAELAALTQRVQELTIAERSLSAQTDALQARIDPHEQAISRLEKELAEYDTDERRIQEALRREESAFNNAQLHFQRAEDTVHRLRHDIEQDLGLVFLETSEEMAYQPPLPWETIVEQLPVVESLPDGLEDEVREMRARLARLVNINPDAPREYAEASQRHDELSTQSSDLEQAAADLRKVVKELDDIMHGELRRTFDAVAELFSEYFRTLFNGGSARIEWSDPDDITTSGVEITARPPGKRPQNLAVLSGGEKTLAACALIFSILRVSPTPFCVLDEVDAALDEANVDRFRQAVEELSASTQFIIITHNRRTLEGAHAIYGITMGNDGASRVISLQLDGARIVRRGENGDADVNSGPDSQPDSDLAEIENLVQM